MCEHKFDVTFIECVATLAHVVNVREHKFDVMLIEYDVMLAHTQQKKHLNKWKPIPFAQKTNPMEEPKNIVGSGREASSGVPFRNSQVLAAELRKDASKPFGHGIFWINRHFQTCFPAW